MSELNTYVNKSAPVTEPERQYFFMERCRELVRQEAEKLGRPLTFCVTTFGCPNV
jgi:tRNA-2-methylthio-N6-dimethylallyladenosine synthase